MLVVKKYIKDGSVYRPDIIWKVVRIKCTVGFVTTLTLSIIAYFFIKTHNLEDTVNQALRFVEYVYFLPGKSLLLKLFVLILTAILIIRLKRILIFAAYLYQKFAPESIRSSCRFTPSCSQYMIMSIEKYGTIIGVINGLKRLSRCHAPNGGYDYP